MGVEPTSSNMPTPTPDAPPAPGMPTLYVRPPPPPKHSTKSTRLTASTLVLIASILLAVSMGVSWWGASLTGGGTSAQLNLYPGSSYMASGAFSGSSVSGTTTYASAGLIHVGQLYEAVLGVGLLAALVGFAGMILGYMGALGIFRSRAYLRITLLLTIISFVGAGLLPGLVALGQPPAWNADGTGASGGTGCGTGSNPCNAFWGSMSTGGMSTSWGADVGWYLSIAAAVLLFVALLQWTTTRRQPYTRDEVWAATPPAAAPSVPAPPGGPAPPAAAPATPFASPPVTAAYCPRCGNPVMWIAQYSRYYCMTERLYP